MKVGEGTVETQTGESLSEDVSTRPNEAKQRLVEDSKRSLDFDVPGFHLGGQAKPSLLRSTLLEPCFPGSTLYSFFSPSSFFFSAFFFWGFKLFVKSALVSSFVISTELLTLSAAYQTGAGVRRVVPVFVTATSDRAEDQLRRAEEKKGNAQVMVKEAARSLDSALLEMTWTSNGLSRPCCTHSRTLSIESCTCQ